MASTPVRRASHHSDVVRDRCGGGSSSGARWLSVSVVKALVKAGRCALTLNFLVDPGASPKALVSA